jgi:hypothetical protein
MWIEIATQAPTILDGLAMLVAMESLLLFLMRKDIGFNIKLNKAKLLKQNPRICYDIDNSKTIERKVVSYNGKENKFNAGGRGANELKVTWKPQAQLVDRNHSIAACLHRGTEQEIVDPFEQTGDLLSAKTIDLMVKDAEQLGELKNQDKLDQLVKSAYIVIIIVAIGAVASGLAFLGVSDLSEVLAPLLKSAKVTLTSAT